MPIDELQREIRDRVRFWGYEENGELLGVMGIQDVRDVSLIRHAYVRKASQNRGVGTKLLSFLQGETTRPLLVGTWAGAHWAISFYERHGFRQVDNQTKEKLLRKYWSIPRRQIETSVVLADDRWASSQGHRDNAAT